MLLAIAQLGVGCATYHPLPLPTVPHLATGLDQLDLTIPAVPAGAPAGRVDISRPLEVDQIGLLAILNDPELRAQRGERGLAEATQRQTSLLPNPSVSINWEALLGGPGTQPAWSVAMTEDITALITYRRRVRAARAQTAQVKANQLWAQWQVAQNARVLALNAYWGDQSIQLASREQQLIESDVSAVRAAVAAGNLDYTALAPLLATEATLDQSLIALQSARENTWKELDGLLGLAPGVRFAIAPPPEVSMPADLEPLIESLPRRRPDLVALQLGYHSADESLRAAILGQFPAFALGPIWEQDTTNIRSLGPTATFEVPLFNRNQAQVAQARATRLMLRDQYQARLDTAVGEVRALQSFLARTRTDITRASAAADSSGQLADAARDAYRQGNLDQRSLTDYENAALERRLEAVALRRSLAEAQVSLTVLLGIGLPQTTLIYPDDGVKR
ncbi:MAG TPA: TolC family protein [Steroidobacteraceae bacterium]